MLAAVICSARTLIADRGYDSERFRDALATRDINPCIPSSKRPKLSLRYDKDLYRQRRRELCAIASRIGAANFLSAPSLSPPPSPCGSISEAEPGCSVLQCSGTPQVPSLEGRPVGQVLRGRVTTTTVRRAIQASEQKRKRLRGVTASAPPTSRNGATGASPRMPP